jgi:hypothetical protein
LDITSFLESVFADFSSSIKSVDRLCILKTLSFLNSSTPDYSNRMIQQLYLLRYAPAYIYEYEAFYEALMDLEGSTSFLRIFSIGSGSGLDYYGAYRAIKKKGLPPDFLYYSGIDVIDWYYRTTLNNHRYYFYKQDVTRLYSLPDRFINVLFFPKSISEFSNESFSRLLEVICNTAFSREQINICASVRRSRLEDDYKRLVKIVECLLLKGDYTLDLTHNSLEDNVQGESIFYPEDIFHFLSNLRDYCPAYRRRICRGERDCDTLNRKPMKDTGYRQYWIIRLVRKERN